MLNARTLFGGTSALIFILLIAALSHVTATLLSYAVGFFYGIVILVSMIEKPSLGRSIGGIILLGVANWLAIILVLQMNLGFTYSTSPALLIISLCAIEAVLIILALRFTWSFQFNFGSSVRQIVYVIPAALLFMIFQFRAEPIFRSWPDLISMSAMSLWCCGYTFGLILNDKRVPVETKN